MKITEFFIKRPTLFWSLMAALIIAGVLAFSMMPKLEDPAVCAKQAMVVVPFPGASAQEVEQKVAIPMEDQLRTLPDVRCMKTECQDGMCMITVEYKWSVLLSEIEQYFDFLRRKVNDIKPQLPDGCYDPIVIDDMMDVYGIFYALTGEGYTFPEMEKYAKEIRRQLLAVKGVKRVNLVGSRSEVVNITLNKEKLARNGMIPTQIMSNLQNAGKTVGGGEYQNQDLDKFQLRISDALHDEKDIENLLIQTLDGKQIRLGDIAKIERNYAEPQTNGFFVDGKPAIAICVALENGVVVPDVGKLVDNQMKTVMQTLPVGMETEKMFFQPDKVDNAINSFMINLLESVLIVIVVLIFTMGFRSGAIIGVGLVLTIAASFPILLVMGTTLQRISLGAFIVAMGMLVDNSIVIMDGILVDKQRGYGPKTYLYRIGKNTAMPLLGATVIAASTFMCIYMSPDTAGEYAGDLFLVLCVSLLMSWVLALVQVPMCAKSWLPSRNYHSKNDSGQDTKIHRFIKRTIGVLVGHKALTISVAAILLVVSMIGMGKVKNMFFSDFDYDQFIVEYTLPPQTSPDRVKHDLLEMTDTLRKIQGIRRVAASMGSAPAHYCLVRPMTNGGNSYGELMVDCDDYQTVEKLIPQIRRQLRETYPDAYIRLRKYNFSISTSHTVEVEFSGPDPAVLRQLCRQAEDIMRQSHYVDPYTVENSWKPKGKSLVFNYNRQDALRSGIERSDVANALQAATDGLTCGILRDNDKTLLVNLLVRNSDGSRIENLNEIPVWSMMNLHIPDGELMSAMASGHAVSAIQDKIFSSVPLSAVASKVDVGWEEKYIYRYNGQRAMEAECDHNTEIFEGTPAALEADVKPKISAISLPDGYSMRWVGESETSGDAIGNLMKYVPVTLFLIFFVLLLLFNSWKKLILILLCFPFVFCGITPALLVFRQPFTFMAIIGFMGLMGMMIKNAIVLVDEINRLQTEERRRPYDAVIEATVNRVRPVIMASLTTILGMIPLIGDPMYNSMAITIMAGLAIGTVITLVLLPVLYAAMFRIDNGQLTVDNEQLTIKN